MDQDPEEVALVAHILGKHTYRMHYDRASGETTYACAGCFTDFPDGVSGALQRHQARVIVAALKGGGW